MGGRVLIGTQGWNYAGWVGPFYPEGTRSADMLTRYAEAFPTVEVDSTFYACPPAKSVRGWAERSPDIRPATLPEARAKHASAEPVLSGGKLRPRLPVVDS